MPRKECQAMDERLRFVARLLDGEAPSNASSLLPLTEVPLRERASGAGLKVSLEGDRTSFVGELHNDIQTPGSKGRCVRAAAVVVCSKPGRHVRGHSGVVPRRMVLVLEDVDESLHE
jgi:hypothetical protein